MWQAFLRYLQVDRTFLLLVFVFSYLLVISNRVRAGMMSWYVLTPEGPLASFAAALLIFVLLRFWLNRQAEVAPSGNRHSIYLRSFTLGLGAYLLFTNALGLLIAALFGNLARNFNPETLLHSNLSQVVDFVLYAGLYLAYHHSQQAAAYRQQLADYQQQLAALQLQQLKAQMNPHFVFNALNTLDELIAVAPEQASSYLQHFASLYRMSLRYAEQQLVPLSDELNFARHYFQLMQLRLGDGYQLEIKADDQAATYWLPPFSLQLLLENALLHNQGSAAQPLRVAVVVRDGRLEISNPLQPKPVPVTGNGVGLANLAKQWLFLSGENIRISRDTQQFSVSLPLLEEHAHV